jgi:hypothetical protein
MTPTLPLRSPAHEALQHSSHPALRRLRVEESAETLVILGSVSSYYLKQLAQEVLRPHQGPRALVNRVEVVGN